MTVTIIQNLIFFRFPTSNDSSAHSKSMAILRYKLHVGSINMVRYQADFLLARLPLFPGAVPPPWDSPHCRPALTLLTCWIISGCCCMICRKRSLSWFRGVVLFLVLRDSCLKRYVTMWSRQEQQPVHTMVSGSKRARVEQSRDPELRMVTRANADRPWLRSHSQLD